MRYSHAAWLLSLTLLNACGGGSSGSDGPDTPTPSSTPSGNTEPDAFNFIDQNNLGLLTQVESLPVTISGLGANATISISGGEYSIDDGANFTAQNGTVSNQNIIVRGTSASTYGTGVDIELTVGGVSDTFTMTTSSMPDMALTVDVNLDLVHSVGGESIFDRSKFIVLHSPIMDSEWNSTAQRDEFLETYDVYLGRNNGAMPWQLSRLEATAANGKLDLNQMTTYGNQAKGWYTSGNGHQHEPRAQNMMFGGQPVMYPMNEHGYDICDTGNGNCKGNKWLEGFDEGATFYSEWLTRYFGTGGDTGEMKPSIIEVLNEPFVHANDVQATVEEISEFHSVVAQKIHQDHPGVMVGGYTAAWPQFEAGNFNQWENTWRTFIDIAGEDMDFYSIHVYDGGNDGEATYRSGSNAEALLDMVEHYSALKHNEIKPFVISEHGHFDRPITNAGPYSKERDWFGIRSFSSLMTQFMERPNQIVSAIPFMILKARWVGTDGVRADGSRYGPRLLRLEDEINGGINVPDDGNWVYTEFLQFFKLWADVKGTRMDTKATDMDIQADAYVDGNVAYVILNNLEFEEKNIALNLGGLGASTITAISSKHVYQDAVSKEPVFEEMTDINTSQRNFSVDYQATKIIKITFDNALSSGENLIEEKYYADKYKQSIAANTPIDFSIDGVQLTQNNGEAVLRIGMGRAHGRSLQPSIKFNNVTLHVPADFRGYDQQSRNQFMGVIEVPVPYELIEADNDISVVYSDAGGFVTSLALQTFESSRAITRTGF